MINCIKSLYLIKDKILDFLPTNTMLKIFQRSSKMLKSLKITINIYELFYNIKKDFEPYDDYLDNDMLSLIYHLSLLQNDISISTIKEYYFRYLREQENISVYYDSIYFKDLLTFLQNANYKNNLIIQINDLNIELEKYTDIDIYSKLINIEFFFNIKWIERDKNNNMSDIKNFISTKIIGINSANYIKKMKFLEPINLADKEHLEFYNFLILSFPNCEFNIQCNYKPDLAYWKELGKFHQLKIIIENNSNTDDEKNETKKNNYSSVPYTTSQLEQINKSISSIKNLHDLWINYSRQKIDITDKYINGNKSQNPEKIIFEDFEYEYKKKYFSELNGILELVLIQKIFKNTNFPISISDKLQSLLVLELEKVNILEDHLANIIRNNPYLEVFEIKKNFSGYVYDKKLANALSNLHYLKILSTHFFWYKTYLKSKELFKDFHIQENQFFRYLKSNSIKYLNISNESNINLHTIETNLPYLIKLSIEVSNLITYDIPNEKIHFRKINNSNNINNKNSENNLIKNVNVINIEEDISFQNLRVLHFLKVLNFGSFLKKIPKMNNLEKLSLINFDKKIFESLIKYFNDIKINCLTIIPDFGEKLTSKQSEPFIKNIHKFKSVTKIDLGMHTIDENLINLLYIELKKLKELKQVKITIELIYESNKKILEEKMNNLKKERELFDIKIIYKERKYKIWI